MFGAPAAPPPPPPPPTLAQVSPTASQAQQAAAAAAGNMGFNRTVTTSPLGAEAPATAGAKAMSTSFGGGGKASGG